MEELIYFSIMMLLLLMIFIMCFFVLALFLLRRAIKRALTFVFTFSLRPSWKKKV